MKIKEFKVEEWMNAYETQATYNIAETCSDSVSLQQLFALCGVDAAAFWQAFSAKRLTYGHIEGHPDFLSGICGLYRTVTPADIIPTHGAAGANHLVISSLVEPGDEVVSVIPTYQQLYSIPESIGATVKLLHLKKENGFQPDLDELKQLVSPRTKLICINNPNNPSGALMSSDTLQSIVAIAQSCGAYLLCDEVYRPLTQSGEWMESIVDLYDKGIAIGSMSKAFSLAGLRLGWLATKSEAVRKACLSHRDYTLISCAMFDEEIAAIALAHAPQLLARNRALVQTNLALLDAWVAAQPHISYVRPQAGTTALLYYDVDLDSYAFCKQLLDTTGALLTPGDCFEEPHSMRIGYACSTKELQDGLAKLGEFLQTL